MLQSTSSESKSWKVCNLWTKFCCVFMFYMLSSHVSLILHMCNVSLCILVKGLQFKFLFFFFSKVRKNNLQKTPRACQTCMKGELRANNHNAFLSNVLLVWLYASLMRWCQAHPFSLFLGKIYGQKKRASTWLFNLLSLYWDQKLMSYIYIWANTYQANANWLRILDHLFKLSEIIVYLLWYHVQMQF